MAIRRLNTKYGTVYHRDRCKSDWKNIKTVRSTRKDGSYIPFTSLTLQEPAIRSIRAVEKELSRPWKRFVVRATGTIRTCALQAQLYAQDNERYAHPDSTLHTHGLAIDVHTSFLPRKLKRALLRHGWHQSRPVDEPWHFSYRLTA